MIEEIVYGILQMLAARLIPLNDLRVVHMDGAPAISTIEGIPDVSCYDLGIETVANEHPKFFSRWFSER